MSFRSIGEIAARLVEEAQAKRPEINRPPKALTTPPAAPSQRTSQEDIAS